MCMDYAQSTFPGTSASVNGALELASMLLSCICSPHRGFHWPSTSNSRFTSEDVHGVEVSILARGLYSQPPQKGGQCHVTQAEDLAIVTRGSS
jgi:hypothetical protein